MKVYTDHNRHFFIYVDEVGVWVTMNPRVIFPKTLPRIPDLKSVPDEQLPRIVEGFLHAARKNGGDNLAIYYIQEYDMSGINKNVLAILLASHTIVAKFGMPENAQKALAEGGALHGVEGVTLYNEAEFNALSVEDRCKIARPFLTDKEAPKTADGETFAKNAWKVANRFVNPKPAEGKAPVDGKPAKEKTPRAKGVKTLIRELFTSAEPTKGKDGVDYPKGDELSLTTEEIMKAVDGTKPSVTTAISDLRSAKYCGKDLPTLNLVAHDKKYSLEGSTAEQRNKKAAADAAAAAEQAKADKKAADKKAADEKAAAEAQKQPETAGAAA